VFRVVLAGEEHREMLAGYVRDRLDGREPSLSLRSVPARTVTLQGAADIHVDDTVLSGSRSEIVSIHVDAGAVELLCPADHAQESGHRSITHAGGSTTTGLSGLFHARAHARSHARRRSGGTLASASPAAGPFNQSAHTRHNHSGAGGDI
jgi:hypothetical protein